MDVVMYVVLFAFIAYMIGNTVKKINGNPAAKAAGLSVLEKLLKR